MYDILIDVTRLIDRRLKGRLMTGVDRVSLEYVKHFGSSAAALVRFARQWIELSAKESGQIFEALLSPSASLGLPIRCIVTRAIPRAMWGNFSRPRFLFNTGHSGLEAEDYGRRLKKSSLRPIFFVHDLIPLTHPEYCRAGESVRHHARMNTVLSYGHGIIANSAATLSELQKYASENGYSAPPSVVARLASPHLPAPVLESPQSGPYFVMLGTIEPRKNHWLLLQLWRRLVERAGAAAPRLVIVGQRGWECENVVDLLERCEALRGYVTELPACSDLELVNLLHHAKALLFPSFAEGYGMPLVEALTLGVPVIASDLAAFREIAGDIPDYVDPLDGKRWGELIFDYSKTVSPLREAQCRRVAGFTVPTWNAHFARVEALLDRLSFENT